MKYPISIFLFISMFFVCSCGDDTGLTQQVLEKALSHKGWKCRFRRVSSVFGKLWFAGG